MIPLVKRKRAKVCRITSLFYKQNLQSRKCPKLSFKLFASLIDTHNWFNRASMVHVTREIFRSLGSLPGHIDNNENFSNQPRKWQLHWRLPCVKNFGFRQNAHHSQAVAPAEKETMINDGRIFHPWIIYFLKIYIEIFIIPRETL